jgi:hypothetical protein
VPYGVHAAHGKVVSVLLFPRVMSPRMSVSREVRSASSGSGAGGTGCLLACQPARVRLGRGDFTRYDSAGALDQPLW